MSRLTRFALLTMAAFLVMGFSATANAAKYDKPQVIRSAGIPGYWHGCYAANFSEREILVTWKDVWENGYETEQTERIA